jgi:hypothetical protein
MIAIAAGVITIIVVVLGFAGDVLGLPWHWGRPAAELLLLAELVGLVVLERHQLFGPVRENVDGVGTQVQDIHAMLTESARTSGQVTACTSTAEVFRTGARIAREALARDQPAPRTLRLARLAGHVRAGKVQEEPDLAAEIQDWFDAVEAYSLTPGSPPDSRARRWSVRYIAASAGLPDFDLTFERGVRQLLGGKPINVEVKILVGRRIEAMPCPAIITDRDALMIFDDATADLRWGLLFQNPQYLAHFERWFDDLWATIPDSYLVYSRDGVDQSAIERISKELEAFEGAQARQPA